MILPTKHIRPERALLTLGAEILGCLGRPKTVSRLWDDVRSGRVTGDIRLGVSYDWFILALDLLFMLGALEFENGLVRRASR